MATQRVLITSSGTWVKPDDYHPGVPITVECIGGGGGGGSASGADGDAGRGGAGAEYGTAGSGGGGGGGAGILGSYGGNGGQYGGGGGGGGKEGIPLRGGNGAQGLIIITYTVRRGRSRAYVIS